MREKSSRIFNFVFLCIIQNLPGPQDHHIQSMTDQFVFLDGTLTADRPLFWALACSMLQ